MFGNKKQQTQQKRQSTSPLGSEPDKQPFATNLVIGSRHHKQKIDSPSNQGPSSKLVLTLEAKQDQPVTHHVVGIDKIIASSQHRRNGQPPMDQSNGHLKFQQPQKLTQQNPIKQQPFDGTLNKSQQFSQKMMASQMSQDSAMDPVAHFDLIQYGTEEWQQKTTTNKRRERNTLKNPMSSSPPKMPSNLGQYLNNIAKKTPGPFKEPDVNLSSAEKEFLSTNLHQRSKETQQQQYLKTQSGFYSYTSDQLKARGCSDNSSMRFSPIKPAAKIADDQVQKWDVNQSRPTTSDQLLKEFLTASNPNQSQPPTRRAGQRTPVELQSDVHNLSQEIENLCQDINVKFMNQYNQQNNIPYDMIHPPSTQIKALKEAKKKRIEEEVRNYSKFHASTHMKNQKFVSDSLSRMVQQQADKNLNYPDPHLDKDQEDKDQELEWTAQSATEVNAYKPSYEVVTEGGSPQIMQEAQQVSPGTAYRKNVLSKSALSNFKIEKMADAEQEIIESPQNTEEDRKYILISRDINNQKDPSKNFKKHEKRFMSTFFRQDKLSKLNEIQADETVSSLFDSKRATRQPAKIETRKPSLMKRRANYFQMPLYAVSDEDYHARQLKTHQRPRNAHQNRHLQFLSHLVQQPLSQNLEKLPSSTGSVSGNQSIGQRGHLPSRFNSSLEYGSRYEKLRQQRNILGQQRNIFRSTQLDNYQDLNLISKMEAPLRLSPPRTDRVQEKDPAGVMTHGSANISTENSKDFNDRLNDLLPNGKEMAKITKMIQKKQKKMRMMNNAIQEISKLTNHFEDPKKSELRMSQLINHSKINHNNSQIFRGKRNKMNASDNGEVQKAESIHLHSSIFTGHESVKGARTELRTSSHTLWKRNRQQTQGGRASSQMTRSTMQDRPYIVQSTVPLPNPAATTKDDLFDSHQKQNGENSSMVILTNSRQMTNPADNTAQQQCVEDHEYGGAKEQAKSLKVVNANQMNRGVHIVKLDDRQSEGSGQARTTEYSINTSIAAPIHFRHNQQQQQRAQTQQTNSYGKESKEFQVVPAKEEDRDRNQEDGKGEHATRQQVASGRDAFGHLDDHLKLIQQPEMKHVRLQATDLNIPIPERKSREQAHDEELTPPSDVQQLQQAAKNDSHEMPALLEKELKLEQMTSKLVAEAEFVDQMKIESSFQSTQRAHTTEPGSTYRTTPNVVQSSYDLDALRNVLKYQLDQMRSNISGSCMKEKNEHQKFKFGKHSNIFEDQKQQRIVQSKKIYNLLVSASRQVDQQKKLDQMIDRQDHARESDQKRAIVENLSKIKKNYMNLDLQNRKLQSQQSLTRSRIVVNRQMRATSIKERHRQKIQMQGGINKRKSEENLAQITECTSKIDEAVLSLKSKDIDSILQSPAKSRDSASRLLSNESKKEQVMSHEYLHTSHTQQQQHFTFQKSVQETNHEFDDLLETESNDSDDYLLTSIDRASKVDEQQNQGSQQLKQRQERRQERIEKIKQQRKAKKLSALNQMTAEDIQKLRDKKQLKNVQRMLDNMIVEKKLRKQEEQMRYKGQAAAFAYDREAALRDAEMNELQMKSSLDLLVEVLADIQIRQQDYSKNDDLKTVYVLERMKKFVKSDNFRKQLYDASDETKKFLNQLFLDASINNDEIIYHDPRKELFLSLMQQYKKKSEFEQRWTEKTNQMLRVLRQSLYKYVDVNQKMTAKVPKYKLKGMRFDKMFSQSAAGLQNRKKYKKERRAQAKRAWQKAILQGGSPDKVKPLEFSSSSDEGEDVYQGELITFSKSTNKIRNIIATRYLSKTVQQLENMELQNVNSLLIFGLMSYMTALFKCMRPKLCPDLGCKYTFMGLNKFRNHCLREILHQYNSAHHLQYYKIAAANTFDDNVIRDRRERALDEELMNLNKMFNKEVDSKLFYQQVKKGFLTDREQKDVMKSALMQFYDQINSIDKSKFIQSGLLHFSQNTLCLFEKSFDNCETEAFANYIEKVKGIETEQIHKLVIDNCAIADEDLSHLLDAIVGSKNEGHGNRKDIEQTLNSIVISNQSIEEKTFAKLQELLPQVSELTINNIKQSEVKYQLLMESILNNIVENGKIMMKLRISGVDLGFSNFLPTMSSLLQHRKTILHLDLSCSQLLPKQLEELSVELKHAVEHLQNLNLSYNVFSHHIIKDDSCQDNFVENMCQYLDETQALNHIDFSGMLLSRESMLKLCKHFQSTKNLQGIHLNNNGIVSDEQYMLKLMRCFGLDMKDFPSARQGQEQAKTYKRQVQTRALKDDVVRSQRIGEMVKGYYNLEPPKELNKVVDNVNEYYDQEFYDQRAKVKDHLFLAKQVKYFERQKHIIDCQYRNGYCRYSSNTHDNFVITRLLNHPELIFNQKYQDDKPRNRFFKKDAMQQWKISLRNECLTCDRYPYTMIFFERGVLAQNTELTEITDEAILKELKYEFNKSYLKTRTMTPQISGTLVQKETSTPTYHRKLKMLRVPVFSLLAICQTEGFAEDIQMVDEIKEGTMKFLRNDTQEIIKQLGLHTCFLGWQGIINDMVNNNELADVKTINLPDISAYNVDRLDFFVFAGYFPPGYHQCLIYDPLQERAYCKDFVIQHNSKDQFPQYPENNVQLGKEKIKTVSNMWVKWIAQTQHDEIMAYESMVEKDKFIPKLLRKAQDSQETIQIVRNSMHKLLQYQRVLMADSALFPLISLQKIQKTIIAIQESETFTLKEKFRVLDIQRSFALALSDKLDDETHKSKIDPSTMIELTKQGLNRTNLVKMLVLLTQMYVFRNFQTEDQTYFYFGTIIKALVDPIIDYEKVLTQRQDIRDSKRLNELLYDNVMAIKDIFNFAKLFDRKAKNPTRMSMRAAQKFLIAIQEEIEHQSTFSISKSQIRSCFCQAMMVVVNETKQHQKYDGLIFVEFLEMIARVAMQGFAEVEPIEWKLFWLLEIFWQFMIHKGQWREGDYQLQGVKVVATDYNQSSY